MGEGDSIAQVSTDKVNVELPSPRAGVIAELPWKPGDIIPVGEVLARIDDGKGGEATAPPGAEEHGESPEKPQPRAERQRVRAAPAVRKYAAEQGVDLAGIDGSGPGGAILKADIDACLGGEGSRTETAGVTRIKLSGPRLAAAKRLEQSWRTLTTTAMTFEVEAEGILAEVERLAAEAGDTRITPLAVVARCVCRALSEHPKFNAVIDENARALDVHDAIHLGFAVDGPDGLLVPVLRDARKMTAIDLAWALAEKAEKARAGSLGLADYQGSTFTISSTGSLEEATILVTTPVINFPNVATLWISRIRERPRVIAGEPGVGPVINASLAFDHRFIHGADATRFINTLDARLRNPE